MKTKALHTSVNLKLSTILLIGAVLIGPPPVFGQGSGIEVEEKQLPPGKDVFNLDLSETEAFSSRENFEVVGHSYFKGP